MSMKKSAIVLVLAVLVTVPLRVYQIYCDAMLISSYVGFVIGVLMIAVGVFFYLSFRMSKFPVCDLIPRFEPILGVLSLGIAGALAFESYSKIDVINTFFLSLQRAVIADWVLLLEVITGFLTVLYFIYLSVCFFINNAVAYPSRLLSLVVPLWAAFRLVRIYLELTTIANVTENIYSVVLTCAIAMFSMQAVRLFSAMASEISHRTIFSYGFFLVYMFFATVVPRYIGGIVTDGHYINTDTPVSSIIALLFASFAMVFLLVINSHYKVNCVPGESGDGNIVPPVAVNEDDNADGGYSENEWDFDWNENKQE